MTTRARAIHLKHQQQPLLCKSRIEAPTGALGIRLFIRLFKIRLNSPNPNIQQIILSKRTPRIDCPLRKQLTEIANDELTRLHSLYSQSSAKIHIGEHNLQCSSLIQTAALFGARGNGRYDGWHLYGNQGVRRYTDSVLNILCEAGVALKSSREGCIVTKKKRISWKVLD